MPRNNDPMTLQERMAYGQQVRESDWASAERRGVDPITGEPLRGSFAAEFLAGPGGRGPVGETEEEYLRRIQHDQYNPFAQSVQRRRRAGTARVSRAIYPFTPRTTRSDGVTTYPILVDGGCSPCPRSTDPKPAFSIRRNTLHPEARTQSSG